MSNKNKNGRLPADRNTTTTNKRCVVHNNSSGGFTAIRLTWKRIFWHFALATVVPFALAIVLRRETSLFASPNDNTATHPSFVGRAKQEKVCRRQVGRNSLDNTRQRKNKTQSSSSLEVYHETLVHPALLSHKFPQQVALVVASRISSDMSVVHHVLKHTTVQHCHVLHLVHHEENEKDASSLTWKDDPRVHWTTVTNLEAARTWFLDRWGAPNDDAEEEEEETIKKKLDVILLDTLLDMDTPYNLFSHPMLRDQSFLDAMALALSPTGVLVAHVGAVTAATPPSIITTGGVDSYPLERFTSIWTDSEATRMVAYSESIILGGHRSDHQVHEFRIVFMDNDAMLAKWYAEASSIQVELTKRISSSGGGPPAAQPLRFLDGATQQIYHFPSRMQENHYCQTTTQKSPHCTVVRGFDPDVPNLPVSALEFGTSRVANAGRGVFFKQAFAKGTYFTIEEAVHTMFVKPMTTKIIQDLWKLIPAKWKALGNYLDGYGFMDDFWGLEAYMVDPGITTFANHGCNGTNNIGLATNFTELTATVEEMTTLLLPFQYLFDPAGDRSHLHQSTASDVLSQSVQAGDEVLDNYIFFSSEKYWEEDLQELKLICLGQLTGMVVAVEGKTVEPAATSPYRGTMSVVKD